MIALLIWFLVVIIVVAAVLGFVRALLALPPFANLQPYTNVIYALIVLIIVLIVVSMFYGGGNPGWYAPPRLR